jgi:polyisoprenoid-binding protein YceI
MKKALSLGSVQFALVTFYLLAFAVLSSAGPAQEVPVFQIVPTESSIRFDVESSVSIKGTFDRWDATLTFTSPDVTTGVAKVRIQAASVDTGNSMKNATLRGEDFLDVNRNPLITFRSTKTVQSGPDTFELDGDFTIRGVTRSEKLTLVVSGKETGVAQVTGTLYFNRRNYGMDSDIPFIKIADRIEVNVALRAKRIGGPPLVFKR